jgi:hypothetical protein
MRGGAVKYLINALLFLGIIVLFGMGCQKEEAAEDSRIMVLDVIEDSPSGEAGMVARDVIISYDGHEVHTMDDIHKFKEQATSDSVEVVILRERKLITMQLPSGQLGAYLKEILPELKRKADAVVIEDIAALDWSTGKSNSFFAALEVVANCKGVDKDYTYLYGVSGAAFRLHFFKGWCPSSPDPTCGFNAGEVALEALGMKYHVAHIPEDDTAGRDEVRKELCVSINKGFPVIAIDLIGIPEWGIVTGYQNAGSDFFCRTYYDRREGYDKADKFPWANYIIDEIATAPSDIENYRESFRIALENLTTDSYGEYVSGISAFEHWIKSLETDDFSAMDEERFREVSHAHAWIYERLIHDREMAVKYLLSVAAYFPGLSQDIRGLAQIYNDEVDVLKPSEDIVVYSFSMKSRDDWSEEKRKESITRLRNALAMERKALEIWKRIASGI